MERPDLEGEKEVRQGNTEVKKRRIVRFKREEIVKRGRLGRGERRAIEERGSGKGGMHQTQAVAEYEKLLEGYKEVAEKVEEEQGRCGR